MSTTEGYESLHNLSPKQLAALAVLKSGGSHDEAASAAGTHRVTVSRPRNELGARGAEVRDDQVQATDGARRGVRDAGADASSTPSRVASAARRGSRRRRGDRRPPGSRACQRRKGRT